MFYHQLLTFMLINYIYNLHNKLDVIFMNLYYYFYQYLHINIHEIHDHLLFLNLEDLRIFYVQFIHIFMDHHIHQINLPLEHQIHIYHYVIFFNHHKIIFLLNCNMQLFQFIMIIHQFYIQILQHYHLQLLLYKEILHYIYILILIIYQISNYYFHFFFIL